MATVTETSFSDIYITANDRKAYIPDKRTSNALMLFAPDDFDSFFNLVESSWDGKNPSYSVHYDGIYYRIERSESISGIEYCARNIGIRSAADTDVNAVRFYGNSRFTIRQDNWICVPVFKHGDACHSRHFRQLVAN